MRDCIDMTGQRFGELTVISRDPSYHGRQAAWFCLCDCGNVRSVRGDKLRSGQTINCGCAMPDGEMPVPSKTRLYRVWRNMKCRCYLETNSAYKNYGGRGITICDEWLHNFQAFYDWAMANGYDEKAPYGQCTIDRIDNNKGYSPGNCRWITMNEQRLNTRRSRFSDGETAAVLSKSEFQLISTIRKSADPAKTLQIAIDSVEGGSCYGS